MDWNLRSCGRQGHVTYRPDEQDLARQLLADTPAGEAWRCLRCADFVVGPPRGHGPAEDAPTVLRGRALRDATVLRLLAVERGIRGIVFVLLGYAVLRFRGAESRLDEKFNRALPSLRSAGQVFNYDVDNKTSVVAKFEHYLATKPSTLGLVAVFLFGYAVVEIIEAVGLWTLKRWGEYFAVVATSAFLPLEVYELTERVTYIRAGAFLLNVAAVVYLLLSKRLFGLRGGVAAYERERESTSLLEVEEAAGMPARTPAPSVAQRPEARR